MNPLTIMENAKVILAAVVTALLVGFVGYGLHSWSVSRLEARQVAALNHQKDTLVGECNKDKQTTEETSHELQNQLSDVLGQLDRAKRLRPNRVVSIAAGGTLGHDGTAQNQELPDGDGGEITSDFLLDFAADAEQVGRKLDSCQGFIRRVWSERSQI